MLIRFRVLINHKVSDIVPVSQTVNGAVNIVQSILLNQLDTEPTSTGVVLHTGIRGPCVVRVSYSLRLYTNDLSILVATAEKEFVVAAALGTSYWWISNTVIAVKDSRGPHTFVAIWNLP